MSSLVLPSLSDVYLSPLSWEYGSHWLVESHKGDEVVLVELCPPPTSQDSLLDILTPEPDNVTFPETRVSYGIPLQLCNELS